MDSDFGQVDFHGKLFSGVDVRVVRLFKSSLQLVQLVRGEGRPVPTMLLLGVVGVLHKKALN